MILSSLVYLEEMLHYSDHRFVTLEYYLMKYKKEPE